MNFEVDGSGLVLLCEVEAESVNGEDGEFFRAIGDPELGDERTCRVVQLVSFDLVFGEPGPKAYVDHDIPEGKV